MTGPVLDKNTSHVPLEIGEILLFPIRKVYAEFRRYEKVQGGIP